MRCLSRLDMVFVLVLLAGCGDGDKPAREQDVNEGTTAPSTVAAPAEAVTAGDETPAVPVLSAVSDPSKAENARLRVEITDDLVGNWARAMADFSEISDKMEGMDEAPPGVAVGAALASGLQKEIQTVALRHGFKDLDSFIAAAQRLSAALAYVSIKEGIDESFADVPPEQRAMLMAMTGDILAEAREQVEEMGITQAELSIVAANLDMIEDTLGADTESSALGDE